MTALKDGRFVFIHADHHHLLVEQPSTTSTNAPATSTATASSPASQLSTQLLYGGVVYAFALNATQTRIAMVCPMNSAAVLAMGGADGHASAQAILRLFAFTNNEVGELLAEWVTAMTDRVVWVGDRYIALDIAQPQESSSDTIEDAASAAAALPATAVSKASRDRSRKNASAVILMEVSKSPVKLKVLREDKSAAAPAAGPGSLLIDLCTSKQSLRLWDLARNKLASESQLPNRKCRHGKPRAAATVSSDGPFVFVANDDWTVHGYYIARNGALHTPKPMLTQFESQTPSTAPQKDSSAQKMKDVAEKDTREGVEHLAVGGEDAGERVDKETPSAAVSRPLPTPRLLTQSLSETQVLLALTGSSTILQCAYDPKGKAESWTVVAKMRLPRRFHNVAEVIGLSRTKVLLRQRSGNSGSADAAVGGAAEVEEKELAALTYVVLPLDLKPTGNAAAIAEEAVAEATTSGETALQTVSSAVSATATAAATTTEAEAKAAEAGGAEGKKKRKKKKKSKKAEAVDADSSVANSDATAAASAPAATAATPLNSRISPAGPTQRAVERLLVHAGISGKDQHPQAFARETGKAEAANGKAGAAAGAEAKLPPQRKESLVSADTLMMAGGVVLGVAVGIIVMRKLSLL